MQRPNPWTVLAVFLAAASASVFMLFLSPVENQAAGFILWLLFFLLLLWPTQRLLARRFPRAH